MTPTAKQKTAAGMVAFLMAFSLLAASACEAPPPATTREYAPPPEAYGRDYAPLIAQIADTTTERIQAADNAAREREAALLKQYEQADYNAMRGVVYEPGSSK